MLMIMVVNFSPAHLFYKTDFYLQKVEDPKVTVGMLLWIIDEHSLQVWEKRLDAFLFICIFTKYIFVCNSIGEI